MTLQTLGYIGLRTKSLEDWTAYAGRFLGMQLVDKSRGTATFRMDDRKQRLVVQEDTLEAPGFFGFDVADAAALDAYAARLERHGVKVARGSRALAEERKVKDLIVFNDPAGNRLEVVHGAETTTDPFKPGRAISGFRTGPLGMGHAVLHCEKIGDVIPFYQDILGFRLSDRIVCEFYGYPIDITFLHTNPRHHSLAFGGPQPKRLHHFLLEVGSLDDVGAALDRAVKHGVRIAQMIGRHPNDRMVSFYAFTPSGFQFEYGWGGRLVDDATWQPVVHDRVSEWGHHPPERYAPRRDRGPK